jgi:lambda family phage portal protein
MPSLRDRVRGLFGSARKTSSFGFHPVGSDGLEGGRMGRRLEGWMPSRANANTLVSQSGKTVLARARYLVRNNAYALGATEAFTANLIGTGITPSWKEGAPAKAELSALHKEWVDEADAEGLTDLYGLERRIGRELFVAGECFIRRRPRRLSDGLSVPLQLQLMPSEICPTEWMLKLENGNWIRQGIEFDPIGRRVAYHFWKVNPGDITQSFDFGKLHRVPAEEVIHVHDPLEAGQIRGLPRLTAAIVPLWEIDGYDDAEVARKKTAALLGVFFSRADPDGELFDKYREDIAKDTNGVAEVSLEPAMAHVLPPGTNTTVLEPADVGNNYEAFQYRMLTRICAALGLPYASVTGDLVKANYSNQRAALLEMRRRMEALQYGVVVHQACRTILRWFMDAVDLQGDIALPGYADNPRAYLSGVNWIAPKWAWIDPLKDAQAEAIAVDNGFKSRSDVIEAQGDDPIEVDNRIAADQKRAKALGIVLRTGTPWTPDQAQVAEAKQEQDSEQDSEQVDDQPRPRSNGDARRMNGRAH